MRPKITNITPECLNEYEAADFINMSVSFLRYHRRHGHIEGKPQGPKFIKLGHKSVRYLPEDLKQWLRNNRCDYEEDRSKERFKPRF